MLSTNIKPSSAWLCTCVICTSISASEAFTSTWSDYLPLPFVEKSGAIVNQEILTVSQLLHSQRSNLHNMPLGSSNVSKNTAKTCQQTLPPGELLNNAVASMPENCELLVQPGSVFTNSSIIMRKGQSICVQATQGHYKQLRADYVLQYTEYAYQLVAVEPKRQQSIPGEGTTRIVAQNPTEPVFIIDGPDVSIDPHLILPLVKPGSGHTGITLTDIDWYKSLRAFPEVKLGTILPGKNSADFALFNEAPTPKKSDSGSDDSDSAKKKEDKKSAVKQARRKSYSFSSSRSRAHKGASGGGGDRPPHRKSFTKPQPRDAIDKSALLQTLLQYLLQNLSSHPVRRAEELHSRLRRVLDEIIGRSDCPEEWYHHIHRSLVIGHPNPAVFPPMDKMPFETLLQQWTSEVAPLVSLDQHINSFAISLFACVDPPLLQYTLSQVIPLVEFRQPVPFPQKHRGHESDMELRQPASRPLPRTCSDVSVTAVKRRTRYGPTIDEARLHLVSAIRGFLTNSTNYTPQDFTEFLRIIELTKDEKSSLGKLLRKKSECYTVPGGTLDENLLSALISFMQRKTFNNHRRSNLTELILLVVSPIRAIEIAGKLPNRLKTAEK